MESMEILSLQENIMALSSKCVDTLQVQKEEEDAGDFSEEEYFDDSDDDFDDIGLEEYREDEQPSKMEETTSGVKENKVLSPHELVDLQASMINNLSWTISVDSTTSRHLLIQYHWNMDKVLLEIFNDRPPMLKSATVPVVQSSPECLICLLEDSIMKLKCGHTSCEDCWGKYLATKVSDQGTATFACFSPDCAVLVAEEEVLPFISNNELLFSRYEKIKLNEFVGNCDLIKWCPATKCNKGLMLGSADSVAESVSCSCGMEICFSCTKAWHLPLNCEMLRLWESLDRPNDLSEYWVRMSTKDCPGCQAPIFKDGGCRTVHCTVCKVTFCFNCMIIISNGHFCANMNCRARMSLRDPEPVVQEPPKDGYIRAKMMNMKYADIIECVKQDGTSSSTKETLLRCLETLKYANIFIYLVKETIESELLDADIKFLEKHMEKLTSLKLSTKYGFNNLNETINTMFEWNVSMMTAADSGSPQADVEKEALERNIKFQCNLLESRRKIIVESCRDGFAKGIWTMKEFKD